MDGGREKSQDVQLKDEEVMANQSFVSGQMKMATLLNHAVPACDFKYESDNTRPTDSWWAKHI